jgi:hypothetical protein
MTLELVASVLTIFQSYAYMQTILFVLIVPLSYVVIAGPARCADINFLHPILPPNH